MGITINTNDNEVIVEVDNYTINIKTVSDTLPLAYLALVDTVPTSAVDTGIADTITIDATYLYVCTATDTWIRIALDTW